MSAEQKPRTSGRGAVTLTPEQIEEGWVPHNGGECPINDDWTAIDIMLRNGRVFDREQRGTWVWRHDGKEDDIAAYRIIEAHGADAEPARPTPASHSLCATSSCALRESLEMLPALWRSREPGDRTEFDAGYEQASGECADVLEQALALSPARPNPFPQSYEELVWDADGWSQTIIVDGKRPEWLRDDDFVLRFVGGSEITQANLSYLDVSFAIRVRRREPKRETVRGYILSHYINERPEVVFDLIDGKPDLSTLKIAEDAL